MSASPIFLTGATGFLGAALVAEFSARNLKPRCLVRSGSRTAAIDAAGFEKVVGDLSDAAALSKAMSGATTVVHAAAVTGSPDPAENFRVNLEGSKHLIEACRRAGVKRVVAVSTISAELARRGPYGESKLMADRAFQESGLDVTIIRPCLIFGNGSKQIESIKKFVQLLPAIVPVIGDGRYKVQPVSVEDTARVIVSAAVQKPARPIYYAAGPEQIPFDELLVRLMKRMGIKKTLIHFPYGPVHAVLSFAGLFLKRLPVNAAQVSTLCQDGICSSADTEKDFGITFEPFDRVLEKMIGSGVPSHG